MGFIFLSCHHVGVCPLQYISHLSLSLSLFPHHTCMSAILLPSLYPPSVYLITYMLPCWHTGTAAWMDAWEIQMLLFVQRRVLLECNKMQTVQFCSHEMLFGLILCSSLVKKMLEVPYKNWNWPQSSFFYQDYEEKQPFHNSVYCGLFLTST